MKKEIGGADLAWQRYNKCRRYSVSLKKATFFAGQI